MKNTKKFLRSPWTLAMSFVFLVAAVFAGRKVYEYSAAPTKPKDCNFAYPGGGADSAPTSLVLTTARPLLNFEQIGGTINDASCLNKTSIYGVVRVSGVEDVSKALEFARTNHLKVTAAGQHHSMGGQSFVKNGLVLDMKPFSSMTLDKEHKVLRVQTGATWADVQHFLDQQGLSVKAMQSINIFTVGGTLSVNAHGIAHDPGPVAPTVRSIRIMLSDGQIKTASPSENADLFRHALGGYGLFGVILDADLDVVDNEVYSLKTQYMDYREFPGYYAEHIQGNDDIGLFFSRLSVAPGSYLAETAVHTYTKTDFRGQIPPLQPDAYTWLDRLVINFSKTGGFGRSVRWMLEKQIEPRLHSCISRNQAMSQKDFCLVSRNQEMYDSMGYLKNRLKDTDILQEYFIPQRNMPAFVDGLRNTVKSDDANLLNVTIRGVHKDTVTALPYAREDMFAFVLYFNQKLNEEQSRALKKTTSDLIDLATSLNGTFYLPYQLYYSPDQLHKAYPQIDDFFRAKKQYDPDLLFDNKLYEKYGSS